MKELSIEEKAQRYDDLLVKLQEAKVDNDVCDERYCCVIDDIVPELAESKDESNDEKIRKALVELISTFLRGHENGKIHGVYAKDILAWLEKQGEHAKFRDSIQVGDKVTRNEDGVLVNLSQLNRVAKKDEKQSEQKPMKTCAEYYNKDSELKMPELSVFQNKLADILMQREYEGSTETEEDVARARLDYELAAIRISEELLPLAIMQKPAEWSEENEKMFEHIIAKATLHFSSINYLDEEEINFLKSLRPQNTWRPSDEQMKALNYVVNLMASSESPKENDYYYNVFKDLKEQLKQL